MHLNGPIGFQFKRDENGDFKLLEINPRIQGSSVTAMALDINLPLLALKIMLDKTYTPSVIQTSGKGFFRFYDEIFYEK